MKKFRFQKGIHTTYIPFLLHNLSPWQEQIRAETRKFLKKYQLGKKHRLGFSITELGGQLEIRR